MGCFRSLQFKAILFVVQVVATASGEDAPSCQPGFSSDRLVFQVDQELLPAGRRVGKVNFDDCSDHKRTVYMSDDSRFQVDTDGTIKVKRAVNLLDGHESFSVHAWDSSGKKLTTRVTVENEIRSHHHHHEDSVTPGQPESSPDVPVLVFPQSSSGEWKRQKRDWVIPPIAVSENNRGNFPQTLVKVHHH
ncbi:cadherin-1-like [Lepisosteus oculatus]|uniref:cadherin-1-like n=1 Tax=Lepisosteus oculatus TaxID=7918 RepID=UPI0035F52909